MKILLFLILMFCQDTDKLLQSLNNDDPAIRESATIELVKHEADLDRFKALESKETILETKWRLNKIIKVIEANQKFRAMSTISSPMTLKFEGTATDLFAKLATLTGQTFDTRAFGDYKVVIDCTNTPLFKILDMACKQIGYDWEVIYYNEKGDTLDQYSQAPLMGFTATINLCGLGMSDKTPNYTGSGFKMQAVQTSFSINNKFGEVATEAFVQFKYAQDPGLKFAVGPKMTYAKIVTDTGVELPDRSVLSRYLMVHVPPTTKSLSIKGKATYRIPMKTETITLKNVDTLKCDPNNNVTMEFADYPDIVVIMDTNHSLSVCARGSDNSIKERFTGKFSVTKKNGGIILENGNGTGSGYLNIYEDHFQFYIYGTPGTDDAISIITFEYITEFRDISFDFAIDNIPLY